jgi:hypothetical protein
LRLSNEFIIKLSKLEIHMQSNNCKNIKKLRTTKRHIEV